MTIDVEINGDLLAMLCGVDLARGHDFTVEYNAPELVQVRRHKKKRINKKWAKRYGYKYVLKPKKLNHCTITPNPYGDFMIECPGVAHF